MIEGNKRTNIYNDLMKNQMKIGFNKVKDSVFINRLVCELVKLFTQNGNNENVTAELKNKVQLSNTNLPLTNIDKNKPLSIAEIAGKPALSMDQAATIIQSNWRRHCVEKNIMLPSTLNEFLSQNLQGFSVEEISSLSKVIARQTVEMLADPSKFQEEGKRINCEAEQLFTDPITKEQTIVKVPHTIWVYLSDDKNSLRVQVYSKEKLGEGTYKSVKSSQTLVVELNTGVDKKKKILNTVYIKSKDQIEPELRTTTSESVLKQWEDEDIQVLVDSMQDAAKIFTKQELENDPKIRIKALPDVTRKHTGKKGIKRLEWEEPMYFGCDFHEICKKGEVKIGDGSVIKMTNPDKFRVVQSVIYTCQKMHEKGIVHRDVKPANVFITYDGQLQGDLGDFDLLAKFGKNELESDYGYWDRCSADGLVLPTTDIFGCAVTFGESVFNVSLSRVSDLRFCIDSSRKISSTFEGLVRYASQKRLESFENEFQGKLNTEDRTCVATMLGALNNSKNFQDLKAMITLHSKSIMNDEVASAFRGLLADLELYDGTAQLLVAMYQADKNLYRYINSPRNVNSKIKLETSPLKDKLKVLEEIYSRFPIFKNLNQRIVSLESQWHRTSGQPQ